MAIGDRIPDLSDKELESLHANAVRLALSGAITQRRQAEELLPLLDAAREQRRAARLNAQAESRAIPRKKKAATS
jgi:hypothetical protein